ncbi:MAG: sulfatase-like hydrolase/transferase [Pirellulaceae bacterium]|nr:sulfatase-like hydrolase/transferase [Pirellulaceae bacterium]
MSHPIIRLPFALRSAGLAFALAGTCAVALADERPNIILCMGDDHGWDETAYNGHPHLRTPVLDEMAATGLRVDRFYSASPVCSPTRGSVITGRHPNRYGTFAPNWSIRPEEISIAQILGKAGYRCGQFGKWHLGPVKADSPTNPGAMGFHEWLSHDNFFEMNPHLSRNGGPPERFQGEGSEIIIDETIRFIGTAQKNKQPFFAVVWFGSPHEPYSGLAKDLALYNELPESYGERTVKLTSMETGRPVKRRFDKVLQERFAEITAMDRAIGQLRQYLTNQGLRQNTLLWYCGDNGVPSSGRLATPFRGQKGLLYEGGVRVPGIIEWPARIPKPRVTDVSAVTSDILPTICDLVGQPLPDRPLDGISLKPLIDGQMAQRPGPICFWNYDTRHETQSGFRPYLDAKDQQGTTPLVKQMDGRLTRNFRSLHHPRITAEDFVGPRSILDHDYKLVVDGQRGSESTRELFNLRHDQTETTNLIDTKPEIAKKLEQQLRAWQQSVLNSLTGADYR